MYQHTSFVIQSVVKTSDNTVTIESPLSCSMMDPKKLIKKLKKNIFDHKIIKKIENELIYLIYDKIEQLIFELSKMKIHEIIDI